MTDLDTVGPVCVHGPVLVMETLELELQVWPPHQGLMDRRLEVKDVVGDCKVVLKSAKVTMMEIFTRRRFFVSKLHDFRFLWSAPERGKEDAISNWES